jgi:hypothetical protein
MLAVVGWGVTSQILSASLEAESRLPSVWPASVKKIICDIWCQALEVPEELQWFPVAHFLMREELSHTLLV